MGGPHNIFLEQLFVSANFFNGSIISSPMKGKTVFKCRCLAEVSPFGNDFRGQPCGKITSGAIKGSMMSISGVSPAVLIRGKKPPTDKTCVASMIMRVPTNLVSSRTLQPSTEPIIQGFSVPLDFLVERPC